MNNANLLVVLGYSLTHACVPNAQVVASPDAPATKLVATGFEAAGVPLFNATELVVPDLNLRTANIEWREPPEAPGAGGTGGASTGSGNGAAAPSSPPESDSAGGGDADLAKKLNNPVASLISVPFQFNYDEGFGPKDAGRYTLNIQPVVPISLSEDWNLIVRTIVPIIHQESLAEGLDSDTGLGDTTQSFFFSPKEPIGGWILAAGPVALWPTGTDPELRSESVGLGPTGLILRQEHGWTYGVLANHLWSVTQSDDHEEVNSTYLQPFLSYTWPTSTTLALNMESSYDWNASEWTIPLNLQLAQLVRIGDHPMQFQIGGRYYADSPDGGAEWGLRFTFTLLFPK